MRSIWLKYGSFELNQQQSINNLLYLTGIYVCCRMSICSLSDVHGGCSHLSLWGPETYRIPIWVSQILTVVSKTVSDYKKSVC